MGTIQFKIQGSAAEPYTTTFEHDGTNLTAHCTCPAGRVGQYCKHRLRILSGETDGIASGNEKDVTIIKSLLNGTQVKSALKALADAQSRLDQAKKELEKQKKNLARVMMT